MKKILMVLAILLVAVSVSACTKKPPVGEEAIAPQSAAQDEDFNLADDKQTPAPVTSSDSGVATVTPSVETPVQVSKTMLAPSQQPDLLKEYSRAKIKTSLGDITVKFYNTSAPLAVNNFLYLAQSGFFDGTKFHRTIKDFMIQGGDPNSKGTDVSLYGTGGPSYKFKNEDSGQKLVAGSLAMANAGPNTNGSQFFIVTASATPWLDGSYTNFGEVESGMDIVNQIVSAPVKVAPSGEESLPVNPITITGVELLK